MHKGDDSDVLPSALRDSPEPGESPAFLNGGGEMGALMRAHDWSASSLGAPETWPAPLRTAVRLLLNTGHPIYIWWGEDGACLYNDAYRQSIGPERHPSSLGRPAREVWAEIWDIIGPQIEQVRAGRGATWHEDQLVPITRNGRREDVYWTYSYSPIDDDSAPNGVGGVLVICTETTEAHVARAALAESEARYRQIVEGAEDFAIVALDEAGLIKSWNTGAERLIGLSEPEAIGQPGAIFFSEEDRAAGVPDHEMNRAAAEGRTVNERWHERKDGTRFWGSGLMMRLDTPGGGYLKMFRDRTAEHSAEAAMRESEERFRNVADHSPVMMWVTDREGRCTYLNRAWYEFTGQSETEAEGMGWLDATHPDDAAEAERVFLEANADRAAFRLEYRLRRADGAYRWTIDAASPRFGADGEFLGYVGSVIDIDERREAEDALRETAEELQTVLDAVPAAIWIARDPQAREIVGNRMSYDVLRLSEGVNASLSADEAVRPTGFAICRDGRELAAEELPVQRAAAGHLVHDFEEQVRFDDGTIIDLYGNATPLRDGEGNIRGAVAAFVDVTHAKRVEAALRESEAELRLVTDALPVLISYIDSDRRYRFANQAYEDWFGIGRADILGRTMSEVLGDDAYRGIAPALDSALAGERQTFERLVPYRRGGERFVHVDYVPDFGPDGAVRGVYALVSDISEAKRAEQAVRTSEARFREQFENANDFIFTADLEMCITSCNPAVARALGHSPESLIGRCIAEFVPPEMWERNKAMLAAKLRGEQETTRYEVDVRAPDGGIMIWDINSRLVHAEDGAPAGLHTIARDVTDRRRAEEILRESEARLRALTDHLPGGMVYQIATGKDGSERRFVYVSQSHERLTGIPAEAVLADSNVAYELIVPEDRSIVAAAEAEAFRTQTPFDVQVRFRRADGEQRWCRIISAPREQPDGSLIWDGIQIDITDQKETEAALRESEGRFRALTQAMPNHVWTSLPNGRLDWFNDRVYEYSGAPVGSLDGVEWATLVHRDDVSAAAAQWAAALASGDRYEAEFRLRRSDGAYRWHIARAAPIRGPSGEIAHWIGTNTDIEDQKAAVAALRESEAQFRAMADNISQFAWMANPDGWISWYNQRWYDYTGTDLEAMQGWGWIKVHHPKHADRIVESFGECIRAGRPWEDTFPLRSKDGEYRWFLSRALPIRDDSGAIVRWFGTNTDITDQRAAEQALRELNDNLEQHVVDRTAELVQAQEALRQSQKLEAMGQLTGGVAHDFNNLLTPIIGSLDLLHRKGLGSAREQRLIEGALQSADRAKTLVQRLLAFARRQPLRPTAVDVRALVSGMAELIASTSGPQIRVSIDVAEGLPAATADANQLEMAILNLSVNARDAMPDGGTLTIAAAAETVGPHHRAKLQPGDYVRLSVADTGIGMDQPTLAHAIEPFFSTKGIGKGTGLGLSMVHGLASQLGGSLAISSRPGLGTNVELWLPVSESAAAPASHEAEPAGQERGQGTALLVDDEELVRMSTADMLGDLGYQVVEAGSAQEALRLIESGQALDVLVTDHLMPGMTGADLARIVQERLPNLPVLIVSGYAEAEEVAPHLPRLTKPFRQSDLAGCMADLMAGRWADRADPDPS